MKGPPMTPSPETLAELERLAKGATLGEWRNTGGYHGKRCVGPVEGRHVALIPKDSDAKFIAAANPATIIQLIAAIRERDEALKPFVAAHQHNPRGRGLIAGGSTSEGFYEITWDHIHQAARSVLTPSEGE